MILVPAQFFEITVTAPVNIAVIKYWGKRDVALLLPTNSSLSVTLNQDHMRAKTTGRLCGTLLSDSLSLNGIEESIEANPRLVSVIAAVRLARVTLEKQDPSLFKLSQLHLRVVSENNFPTAAGLASSAAGFAALAFCLANLFQLNLSIASISSLARVGSGSACRSLYGGYVEWQMGTLENGEDSIAIQVAPASHWKMSALVLVASDLKKHTSSSAGMQTTVATSSLLTHRTSQIVPQRMIQMKEAIANKDFDSFAELTMKDSNQFHAVCLDTFPPINYLTPVSFSVISVISAYNEVSSSKNSKYKAAYTFDAGPNAVIYTLDENIEEVMAVIAHFFPTRDVNINEYYGRGFDLYQGGMSKFKNLIASIEKRVCIQMVNSFKKVIFTGVGEGPQILANEFDDIVSLMDINGNVKL